MARLESEKDFQTKIKKSKDIDTRGERIWNITEKNKALEAFDAEASENAHVLPEELRSLFDNAQMLLKSGEFQIAKRVFLAILQKQGKFDPAHRGFVACLEGLGDAVGVAEHLRLRAEIHPTFASFFDLAECYYKSGAVDAAEEAYLSALQYPHIEGAALFTLYKNLGNIALFRQDYGAAEENYNKAYTLNDRSDVLLINFGSLALHRGHLDRAVTCYRAAIGLNPLNAKAWIGLGMLHREFGDYELSWANIEKAMDLDPGNETGAKLVSEWGMKDNEIERTVRLLAKYLQAQPDDAFHQMMIAKYYYLIGNVIAAYSHIEQANDLNSTLDDLPELRDIIAQEYQKAGF